MSEILKTYLKVTLVLLSGLFIQSASGADFVMIRHAKAPGNGDPDNFKIGDCTTQRNLSSEGVDQAKAIGQSLRAKLGKEFWVFTSQWCRCKDTAKQLGGKTPKEFPVLNSFYGGRGDGTLQTKELRAWIKENLQKYSPLVLVTHQVNITELTGIFPNEGEILFLTMDKDGAVKRTTAR